MASAPTKTDDLLRLARKGPLRARDLAAAGIPRVYLGRLCDRGLLEVVDRGLYRLTDASVTENDSLAEVSKRVPHATVCLLSALQFHGMTTESPHAVWVMIDRHARRPKLTYPKLEVVRASAAARDHGVQQRTIEGVVVQMTSPAKTVADCFRYRRHVGLEVAIAALRDYLDRSRRQAPHGRCRQPASRSSRGSSTARDRDTATDYSIDALVAAARADRVYALLRPYLEALA